MNRSRKHGRIIVNDLEIKNGGEIRKFSGSAVAEISRDKGVLSSLLIPVDGGVEVSGRGDEI